MVVPFPAAPLRPGRPMGRHGWTWPLAALGIWPIMDPDAAALRVAARMSMQHFAEAVAGLLHEAGFDVQLDRVAAEHAWIDVAGHEADGRVLVVRHGDLPAGDHMAAVGLRRPAVEGVSYSVRDLPRALAAVRIRHPRSPAPPLP